MNANIVAINMFHGLQIGATGKRVIPFLLLTVPGLAQLAPGRYTLLLEDPPVASRFAAREEMQSAAAINYRAQLEARQRQVRSELDARHIQVTGSVTTLLNAIFVTAPADRIPELESIPGVAAVRPMHRFKPLLNKATQLMNAPAAWSSAAIGGQGNAGKGIKIAILDTGIDQTHPALQDSSLSMPSGFPICDAVNQPVCSQYTNSKVIVARSYVPQIAASNVTDPNNPAAQSQPDDYTPRDRVGHGTAVASAAAGNQNSGAVSFTGMAPKAYLGNYKIYGSPGVNDFFADDVLIQALNDAFNDGMDVASLSSGTQALTGATDTGATCGIAAGLACDPVAAAFEAAAQKGLTITVAVGNSGNDASYYYGENYPYFNSISSPASAPSVIGVGATTNAHALTPTVSVNASSAPSNLKNIAARLSDAQFYPSSSGANMGPLLDVAQLGNDGYACSALPAGSLNGSYALIQRGPSSNPCTFAAKASNAQAAGATGVVFYMSDSTAPISPGGLTFLGPAVMISNSDGVNLKNYIDANPGQLVTIDTAGAETDVATYNNLEGISPPVSQNQLASYSSFGPTPDGLIKPDLVATGGLDVFIASSSGMYLATQNFDPNGFFYSVNRYAAGDGTSFATPLVAGAAALVKQAHPSYKSAQIKSALVNFAAQDTTTDDGGVPVNVQWLGAGRLDAGAATASAITVQPATISFGYVRSANTLPITKQLTVSNSSSAAVTLTVAVAANNQPSGTSVAVDKTSLPVPAGGSATLNVTLSGSVPAAGSYSGQVTMQATGVSVHVPFMFLQGTGFAYNVVPTVGGEGVPGQDVGASFVQVVDQYGVPVQGQPVSFSASRSGVIFNSVTGEPACTGSGSSSVTCATDNYGFAYAETVMGSSTGSPVITVRAAGLPFQAQALILPQPAITQGQIVDNAAFLPVIAPGSIAAIKGSNLMNPGNLFNSAQGYDLSNTPFWLAVLDGVNVSFDVPSAKISVPAPIVAVSPGQINVQVPWELKGQTSAQVKVIIDEVIYGNVVAATLADYNPAFFANGNVADAVDNATYKPITSSNPATRGQFIQLYANGLGPVTNTPADGFAASANATTTTPCSVSIGGQTVTPQFCGIPQGLAIYQVNIQVPQGLSTGNQPVTISIGGKTSPSGIVLPVQ
jgi:uncharacterized protein (TIGR03437 family)